MIKKSPYDKANMRAVILNMPKQLREGLQIAKNVKLPGKFSNIIFSGVGGSAMPYDIISSCLQLPLPAFVNRAYGLHHYTNKTSAIFCISYSGNTEETISAFSEAIDKKFKVCAVATGGKLIEMAKESNIPYVQIPDTGIQPRCATGYLVSAVAKVLANSKIIPDPTEQFLKSSLQIDPIRSEGLGKKIADDLVNFIPVVYASDAFKAVAKIWKIKFNENSKTPAFWNYFPELNHNEMVGYTHLTGKFHVLILKDAEDHPRNLKRMQVTSKLLKEKRVKVTIVDIEGEDKLMKTFSALILGDWASYYLALNYKQDPSPVQMVEDLKKALKE